MTEQPNYYAVIPANVRYDLNLKPMEKILYGEITCLTKKTGECWATNSYFAELYKVSIKQVSKWITNLKKQGYVDVRLIYFTGTKQVERRAIHLKMGTPYGTFGGEGMEQKVKDNNTSINNTSNREQEAKASLLSLKKEREQKIYTILEVFKEFDYEIKLWGGRRQNREAAEILYDVKGVDKVRNILFFFKNQYKGTTTIGNTYDLLQKYDVIKKEYAK